MPAEVVLEKVNTDKSVDIKNTEETKETTTPRKINAVNEDKQYRKRKRKHFNSIREQMEFYFGDANLSKDRFLKQLIDKDPYVSLDIFLTFNKMKILASSVEEIAKSLTNSQLLELDDSQQKVRRKTALPAERDVDDKTLYVESIPPNADHDWMKQIFTRFGNVTYVSLPKYAKSRKIKEFGFIEFEKIESIGKAVKAFQEFKGVLSMQETDPAELKSIKAYIKEQNKEAETSDNNESGDDKSKISKNNKRKSKVNAGADDEAPPLAKKFKTDDSSAANSVTEDDSEEETAPSSAAEEESAKRPTETLEAPDELSQKKRRKKKKKSKKLRKVEQNNDASFYDLKVLPKRDWKRLRNKYLNLQREKISELKRAAWKAAQHSGENLTDASEANAGVPPPSLANKPKPSDRKLQKINMNFYGAGDADTNEGTAASRIKETKTNPALERAPLFSYEPGLIIEVTFLEPCVVVKEFKADMRQYATVKYVDVKEGALQAYLRLESASAADEFIKQVSCAEYKCKLVTGEAESEYWRKIEQDREMKLNKKVKVPQRRGRDKVKKLLTKHIRFGDEDEGE